jgi:hypothetical protein
MVATVGKVVLGMMGRLRPKPATGDSTSTIALPAVDAHGGMALMEALAARRSSRAFAADPLPLPLLGGLLWAAYGVNRPDGGRTAPSAINAQEIDVYAALPTGAFLYDAVGNVLTLVAAADVRRVTGYQDFVDEAPLDLVYAAAHGLATVIRAWIDRDAIADALGLTHDQQVLFSQTVGYPKR